MWLEILAQCVFWGVLCLAFFIVIKCVEEHMPFGALATIVITGCIYQFCFKVPIGQFLIADPKLLVFVVLGYLVIGAAWMYFKWNMFVKKMARESFETAKAKYQDKDYNSQGLDLEAYFKQRFSPPQAYLETEKLSTWMFFWPFTLCQEPIVLIFKRICSFFEDIMSSAADRAYDKVVAEHRSKKKDLAPTCKDQAPAGYLDS